MRLSRSAAGESRTFIVAGKRVIQFRPPWLLTYGFPDALLASYEEIG
jgi:hypothetical protein